jgi:hypothetical protein
MDTIPNPIQLVITRAWIYAGIVVKAFLVFRLKLLAFFMGINLFGA